MQPDAGSELADGDLQGAGRATSSTASTRTPTRTGRTSQVYVGGTIATSNGTARDPDGHVDAPGRDLRRHELAPVRQRRRRSRRSRSRRDRHVDRRAADRRQRDLGRVVRRPDRRGAHLQPRAHRGRDPGRHEQRRSAHPDTIRRPRPAPRRDRRLGQVTLSLGAGDRQRRRRPLQRPPRRRRPGFTPTPANRIAQPTGTSYTDTGLAAGTYYYRVTAQDAAGNVGPASNEASAIATADTTAADRRRSRRRRRARPSPARRASPRTRRDNGAVAGVQFKLDGANLGRRGHDRAVSRIDVGHARRPANGSHTLPRSRATPPGNTTTSAPSS